MVHMVQREGYWVPRDDSLFVDVIDNLGPCRHGTDRTEHDQLRGWGVPGVRFRCHQRARCAQVVVTLGGDHREGDTPTLLMSLDMAQELAELLMAAVVDGRIAHGADLTPVPFRDITRQPCGCGCEVPLDDDADWW